MENIILGKVLKAMQKLSGRSIGDLADETDMTIDTLNNLFYARVQKPSFSGVCTLVEHMGFTVSDLIFFLRDPDLQDMDVPQIMEVIAAYTNAGSDPAETTENRETAVRAAKERIAPPGTGIDYDTLEQHNERVNEMHEKQLDRFKATHLGYVEQLKRQYEAQLAQAEDFSRTTIHGLEKLVDEQRNRVTVTAQRYEQQVTEMRTAHEKLAAQQQDLIAHLKKTNSLLTGLLAAALFAILMILLFTIK